MIFDKFRKHFVRSFVAIILALLFCGVIVVTFLPVRSSKAAVGDLVSIGDIYVNTPNAIPITGLVLGTTYRVVVSGTASYGAGLLVDAQWGGTLAQPTCWCGNYWIPYFNGLRVDAIDKGTGVRADHTYTFLWVANTTTLQFFVADSNYADNSGFLSYRMYVHALPPTPTPTPTPIVPTPTRAPTPTPTPTRTPTPLPPTPTRTPTPGPTNTPAPTPTRAPTPTPTPIPPTLPPFPVTTWSGNITVYWGTTNDVCSASELTNTMAALDIIVISGDRVNPVTTHYPVDPCAARATANNFEFVPRRADVVGGRVMPFRKTINVATGLSVRVVSVYANTVIGVRGCDGGGAGCRILPPQGVMIESLGVSDKSQRKIVQFKPNSRVPADVFPFVLFAPK